MFTTYQNKKAITYNILMNNLFYLTLLIFPEILYFNPSFIMLILKIRNPASGKFLIWQFSLGNWYEHAGGEPGIATQVEFEREDKVGIIIFADKRNNAVNPGNRIHAIVRREADKYRQMRIYIELLDQQMILDAGNLIL